MCLCVWCMRCGACCVCCVVLLAHIPNPRLIAVFAAAGVPSGDIPGPEPRFFLGDSGGHYITHGLCRGWGAPGTHPGPEAQSFFWGTLGAEII